MRGCFEETARTFGSESLEDKQADGVSIPLKVRQLMCEVGNKLLTSVATYS